MIQCLKSTILALVLSLTLVGPAAATLTTIGQATYGADSYNLIYDNDYAAIYLDYSPYSLGNWAVQNAWANSLGSNLTNITLNSGVSIAWDESAWRLPSASELSHLYHDELDLRLGYDSVSPFLNLVYGTSPWLSISNAYWTSTVFPYYFDEVAIICFSTEGAYGTTVGQGDQGGWHSMAIRSGHVEGTPVPEPSTFLLLGFGFMGVAILRKRVKK